MVTLVITASTASLLSAQPVFSYWLRRLQQTLIQKPLTPARARWLLAVVLGAGTPAVVADQDTFNAYQQKVLFNPGGTLLKAESRGRVTIYDGMDDSQIETAMDEQFERIENMMFVRTRRPAPDGTFEHDDDGCD